MKKILRFIALKEFSLIDLIVGAWFMTLLNTDHIAWAFVALIAGALVSSVAEKAAL